MVAAETETTTTTHRPPLLPSERDNGGGGGGGVSVSSRKPKSRNVTSRYLSSSSTSSTSSSSSSSSSNSSKKFATPFPARSQSLERRRPATPRPGAVQLTDSRPDASVASKILFTSTRSLAVSFQGESFSLPISKIKPVPAPQSLSSVRRSTPERRRNTPSRGGGGGGGEQVENSKPVEQHRWPGRARQVTNSLSKSLDCTSEKKKFGGSGNVVRALQQSMIDEGSRVSIDGRNAVLVKSIQFPLDTESFDGSVVASSDPIPSDTDSFSSGNSGIQECGGLPKMRNGARAICVPARFWQETNSRLRRLQEPGTPMGPPKLIQSKRYSVDSPLSSPRTVTSSRGMSSPLRGPVRPASPSKMMVSSTSSPARGMPSPSRTRNATGAPMGGQLINMPSVLSFAGRGKLGENRVVDAHQLRLLYNRQLQWRFVNARTDAAMLVQRLTVEKNLYDAWITMSKLRDSVTAKRIKLQFMRQNLKLTSILKGQMSYLEECGVVDREHSTSLSGAIDALEACTLRLPVVGGARADIQNMKDAVGSAVDVMQAMASSICSSLSRVEEVNNLAAELAIVTRRELGLLDQCKHLLSMLAAMQVKDCSLQTHILQLKRSPTTLTTQV